LAISVDGGFELSCDPTLFFMSVQPKEGVDPRAAERAVYEEVAKLIQQRVDGIKADKDQALAVLPLYFNAYLYGAHRYARPSDGDEISLPNITREAIVKFYQAEYTPGNAILAVVGDFDRAEMEKMLTHRNHYVGIKGWVGIELREISDDELGAHLTEAWKLISSGRGGEHRLNAPC
jgi:hypothetical protein